MGLQMLEDRPAPRSLWAISEEMLAVEHALDDEAFSDEDRAAAIDAYLAGSGELATKLDNYAALIRDREARAKARRDEAARITNLAQADDAAAKRLKDRLKAFFELHGLTKQQTPRYVLSVQANGGRPAVEVTVASHDLPTESIRRAT